MSPVVVQPLWFFPFPSFPALPRLRALQGSENVPGSFPAVTTRGKGVWTAPNPLRCCPRAFAKPGQPCLAAARGFGVFPTFRVFANCFEASAATRQIAFLSLCEIRGCSPRPQGAAGSAGVSEPGASPRLRAKDTAAPGSPGSPSISTEAKFLSAERKEFSPPPESGWAEGRRPDLRVGWICLVLSPLQSSASVSGDFRVVLFVGDTESPLGAEGTAQAPLCLCCTSLQAAPALLSPGQSCPTMDSPSGRALQAHSCILSHAPQVGTRFPLLSRAGAEFLLLLRLPGAGESGRAGTACLAGAPSSLGSLARSSGCPGTRSPSGHARPSALWADPSAGFCFAVLGNSEKQRPIHPQISPSTRGQARGILLNAGKAEVGREETEP